VSDVIAGAASTVGETLRGALGRPVPLSVAAEGPAGELVVAVSPKELGTAAGALLGLGASHVMLVAFDGDSARRAGAAPAPAPTAPAIEEVLAVPDGPIVRLRVELPIGDPTYPSLTPLVPAAQWDEREAHDLHGIVPTGHPDLRPLVIHEPAASAAPYRSFVAHGDGVYQLPVGPIHAGIIEPGHFRFSAVGESVLYLDARLFYTHRGLERLVEGRTFAEALPVVERACGVCTVTHATAFSQAVERLTGTEPPPRAQAARVLLAEMERLYNHVGDLGNICAGVGFNFGVSRLGWQKERLLRLNEALTGHRYLMGVVAPGGLRLDLDERGLLGLGPLVAEIEHEVRSIVRLLVRSDGFMNRLHGTGILTREAAVRLGAQGVAARASGLAMDLRLDRPTGAYRDVYVPQIGASAGDVAARVHVRAQEAAASAAIVARLADSLPYGDASAPLASDPKPGSVALAGAEGPRGASWLWLMAGPDGRVGRVHLRSASYANWPVVASVVPGNLVPDFPLINKSFELCYACTDR
jgi:Ni,Fe-hydrogenase III large subunit/NADH:ubiquinone oxidoreductase subunit C